jgi:hypothetical protein
MINRVRIKKCHRCSIPRRGAGHKISRNVVMTARNECQTRSDDPCRDREGVIRHKRNDTMMRRLSKSRGRESLLKIL